VLTPFVDALPVPAPIQPSNGVSGGAAHYEIPMRQFAQKLHRDLPATTVWGYGNAFP
jgi:spore coat protein A